MYAAFVRKRAKIAAVAALTIAVVGLPLPAHADDAAFVFDPPTSIQVEYGAYWVVNATTDIGFQQNPTTLVSQTPGLADPGFFFYPDPSGAFAAKLQLTPSPSTPPLAVGSYPLDITLDAPGYLTTYHAHATGATLEVVPAALTPSVTLDADPTASGGLVVTGLLSGGFLKWMSQVASSPPVPVLPAGSWSFVIKDSAGKVALEKNIDDAAGGPAAVSFYWDGATAGEDYTATADFTVEAASAENFSVAPGTPTTARTDVPSRPVPVADAPAPGKEPTPSGFSVPLWAIVLGGLAFLILAVALVLILVRGRGRRAPTAPAITDGSAP